LKRATRYIDPLSLRKKGQEQKGRIHYIPVVELRFRALQPRTRFSTLPDVCRPARGLAKALVDGHLGLVAYGVMSDRVKLAREIAARTEARLVETKTPSGGLEGGSVYEHYL